MESHLQKLIILQQTYTIITMGSSRNYPAQALKMCQSKYRRKKATNSCKKSHNNILQSKQKLSTLIFSISVTLISVFIAEVTTNNLQNNERNYTCPKLWTQVEDTCYRFVFNSRNLDLSKSKCLDLNSQLANVDDDETFSALRNLVSAKKEYTSKQYYIQLSDELYQGYKNKSSYYDDFEQSTSEMFLSPDDPSIMNISMPLTSNFNNSFVFTYSAHKNRWGLIPFDPTKKGAFICELAATSAQQTNQAETMQPHSFPINELPKDNSHKSKQPFSKNNTDFNRAMSQKDTIVAKESSQTNLPSMLFREQPQDLWVVLGSTAELRCSAMKSDSSLNWTFKGKILTSANRRVLHSNGTLNILAVRNSDVGTYTCNISNGNQSETKTAKLQLILLPHPPISVSAELLSKTSTSVKISWLPGFDGNSPITKYSIEMKALVSDTESSNSSSWENAKSNVTAEQSGNTLRYSEVIPDLKPARKYIFRVRACNKVGCGDASNPTEEPIEVPIQPPSSPPENLVGSPKSSTSILIKWSPPPKDSQNGLIRGYKVRHKLAGYGESSDIGWSINDVTETNHLSYTLDDLIVWQNYEIQVAAVNDRGVGPYSSTILVKTKEGKPEEGPENVNAVSLSPESIKISWDPIPPQHLNGINQGYKVQLYLDQAKKQLAKEVIVSPNSVPSSSYEKVIDGLLAYTKYYISVLCFTSDGDGPPNEGILYVETDEGLPEIVSSLDFDDVLDKSLRIIWTPPKRLNGKLVSYNLEYSDINSPDRRMKKSYGPDSTEDKIVDLSPQTTYVFKMFAQTRIGRGPDKVANITTRVPPSLPEPPSNLVCTNICAHNVTIQFNPGFDGNAIIEKWIAEAQIPNRDGWIQVYTSTNHSKGNTIVVRNLKPYTRYRIRLIPVNIVGRSHQPSDASPEFQTLQIEPEQPPKDFMIEDIRSNSLTAKWSPLHKAMWQGNPRGYNLTWSESDNPSSTKFIMINDTDACSYVVSELEEFTEYTFRLYAINEAGSSASTNPFVITTAEDAPSSSPTNVTAQAISSSSILVRWLPVPKIHRNGIIRGYKIQYQGSRNIDSTLLPQLYKYIEDNNTQHTTLTDLKSFSTYHLAISAYTSAGDGLYSDIVSITTKEDTPSMPTNLSFPIVSQTSALIFWDAPEDPNGEIVGYKISYHPLNEPKEASSHELSSTERTFKANNLKTETHYVFTVVAKTREGWGQQANMLVYTYDSELRANLPYYRESWFVISCACLSAIITIIITAILYVQTKSYKYKQDAINSASHDKLGEAGFSIDDDLVNPYHNGFGMISQSATQKRNGSILSQNGSILNVPKNLPKPYTNSMAYSDEQDDDVFDTKSERPKRNSAPSAYDTSDDSMPGKPSEGSSSTVGPGSETAEDEYVNMPNRTYVNYYANMNGTNRSQKQAPKNTRSHHHEYQTQFNGKVPQRPVPVTPNMSNSSNYAQGNSSHIGSNPIAQTAEQLTYDTASHQISHNQNPNHQNMQMLYQSQDTPNSQISNNQLLTQARNPVNQQATNQYQKNSIDEPDSGQQSRQDNSHILNLNGGRIIVDNMAGSRAPLPGFTSFV